MTPELCRRYDTLPEATADMPYFLAELMKALPPGPDAEYKIRITSELHFFWIKASATKPEPPVYMGSD